jgi:hypothetical protein
LSAAETDLEHLHQIADSSRASYTASRTSAARLRGPRCRECARPEASLAVVDVEAKHFLRAGARGRIVQLVEIGPSRTLREIVS